jgi:hypothetical protein
MKLLFAAFVSALALSAQAPQADPPVKKPAPKAASKVTDASQASPIPPEAVLGAGGEYHYTDPQGKKWIYRHTPFGVTHVEDTPQLAAAKAAAAQTAAATAAGIKATEDGDKVRFERQGPFGLWKWEKKKSELEEFEKAALANSQASGKTASKQD